MPEALGSRLESYQKVICLALHGLPQGKHTNHFFNSFPSIKQKSAFCFPGQDSFSVPGNLGALFGCSSTEELLELRWTAGPFPPPTQHPTVGTDWLPDSCTLQSCCVGCTLMMLSASKMKAHSHSRRFCPLPHTVGPSG